MGQGRGEWDRVGESGVGKGRVGQGRGEWGRVGESGVGKGRVGQEGESGTG